MTRLAQLIEEHKMTVREVSEATGIHERMVRRHIRGQFGMKAEQALAYARLFGITVEELLEDAA